MFLGTRHFIKLRLNYKRRGWLYGVMSKRLNQGGTQEVENDTSGYADDWVY